MLSTLPTELLIQILHETDFGSHLNLALTCRRFFQCLKVILARHRHVHQKYHHMTTAVDGTVRDLVRSVVGLDDPIYAWHVRSLDVWIYGATNPLMDSWGPDDEKREIESHWPWRTGEIDAYSRFLGKYFKPDTVKDFMSDLEERKLEFFKVVLYFTLPRLRELRYSSPVQDDCTIDDLYWAQSYLKQGHPPVLQQLESVAVGVDLGATQQHLRPIAELGPDTLIQLMRLPNLKSLYCYGLGRHNTTLLLGCRELETPPWQEAIKEPSAASSASSLEHFYLDCVDSWPEDLDSFQDYVASIPAALKTFVIRPRLTQPNDLGRPNINAESFALAVLKHQEDSIQSCVVYDHQARDPGLTCLAKKQTAGEWGMRHHLNNFNAASSPEAALQLSLTTYIDFFTTDVALSRLCVLTLHGDDPNEFLGWPECVDVLEEGIMALIRSKRNPRLRTIHLLGFQDRIGWVDTRLGTIRFQKAIIEGIKHSVDVYTSTTPRPLATLMDRRMALVPKAFRCECPVDIEFGRLYIPGEDEWRRPDRPMAFNARTGEWEDPLCNRCGDCETCFKRYPRESWAAAQKERETARRERDAATGQPRAPYALMHNGGPWWF